MPLLRGTEIGCVYLMDGYIVAETGRGRAKAIHDRGEVIRELGAGEAPNILEEKCAGSNIGNGANRVRPHIARVSITFMLSADAEWLAGGASCDKGRSGQIVPMELTHICLHNRPMRYVLNPRILVVQHGCNRVMVPLEECLVIEACAGKPERQSTTSCKEFDASHLLSLFGCDLSLGDGDIALKITGRDSWG